MCFILLSLTLSRVSSYPMKHLKWSLRGAPVGKLCVPGLWVKLTSSARPLHVRSYLWFSIIFWGDVLFLGFWDVANLFLHSFSRVGGIVRSAQWSAQNSSPRFFWI